MRAADQALATDVGLQLAADVTGLAQRGSTWTFTSPFSRLIKTANRSFSPSSMMVPINPSNGPPARRICCPTVKEASGFAIAPSISRAF